MKHQNRIWQLITRKLTGEITEDELNELNKALKEHPEAGFYLQIMTDIWSQRPTETMEEKMELYDGLKRIKQKIAEKSVRDRINIQKELNWNKVSKKTRVMSNDTLANYFKIAWRNLSKNKVFSFINITGLAIGMASAILIILWIVHEFSYDQFHSKKDRIYQLYNRAVIDGEINSWGSTPMVMAPVIRQDYPEVEKVARVSWVAKPILKTADKKIQTQGLFVDPEFLAIFDFPLLHGDANTALNDPHSIVITEKLARKMFVDGDAIDKMITIDSNIAFKISGVVKDPPDNTNFNTFEYLLPWSYMKEIGWTGENWGVTDIVRTYILTKPGISEETLNNRFRNIIRTHAKDVDNEVFVHPITKWHLWSNFENGKIVGGGIDTIRLFAIIAGFILLIACINYMNLSTARSVKRAREVGVRKVIGAQKRSLIGQFLWESILFCFLAGILAILIVQPSFSWFNELTDKKLSIPWSNPYFWLGGIAFILFTGLLAGSYPAFYLSSFKPIKVLKGTFKAVNALVTPRKILVVVQFSFAIIFIICTIIIYRQIAFGKNRETGFDMKNLGFVYNQGDMDKNYSLIKNDLLASGAITSVARTSSPIIYIWHTEDAYDWQGKDKNVRSFFFKFFTDGDYVKTFGLKLLAGRDIDISRYPTDSTAILLNESAVRTMGFKEPIGQLITNAEGQWHVVGVLADFLPGTPYSPIYPATIHGPASKNWFGTINFRLNESHSTSENLAKIGSVFKKHNPDYPFEAYFVADGYSKMFEGDERQAKLAAVFAGLTIFISCLGLFALATYMAENRIKEIGIRKVLGASPITITTLLSKDFLKLVLISFVVASPLAWWAMHSWLQDYSYRVSISWWIFALTALISILIAVATISYQSIKAALANPVKSLRSE